MAGSFKREETYVFLWLIHVYVWQKPTQYFKSAIPHLKINKLKIFKNKENEKIKKKNLNDSLGKQFLILTVTNDTVLKLISHTDHWC